MTVCRSQQLCMSLLPRVRWGSRRTGAGRQAAPRPRIRHTSREPFGSWLPAHVTIKVRSGLPSLRTVRVVREIEESLAVLSGMRNDFLVVEYSIQRDHLHAIIEAADRGALGRGMKSLCARVARAMNRVHRRSGPVLADRYHIHVLRTPREARHALAYVLLNARRHSRCTPRGLTVDAASSGRWFRGWKRQPLIPRVALLHGRRAPPVALARTWLLRVGWRRHGLIDPAECPGGRQGAGTVAPFASLALLAERAVGCFEGTVDLVDEFDDLPRDAFLQRVTTSQLLEVRRG